jgi:hypothetical protein
MNKPNPSNSLIKSREVGSSDTPSIPFNMFTHLYMNEHRVRRSKYYYMWVDYFGVYYEESRVFERSMYSELEGFYD